jgi:hypothetical protein
MLATEYRTAKCASCTSEPPTQSKEDRMSTAAVPQQVTAQQLQDELLQRFPNPEEASLEELTKMGEELSLRLHIHITIRIETQGKKGGKTTIVLTAGV